MPTPRALIPAAVLASSLAMAPTALATYPGVNGPIVFAKGAYSKAAGSPGFTGAQDLFTAPAVAGAQLTQLTNTKTDEFEPTFSPDGKWLAYTTGGNKTHGLWVRSATGTGGAKQVSTLKVDAAAWSPDGTKLAFDTPDGLYEVDVSTATKFLQYGPVNAYGEQSAPRLVLPSPKKTTFFVPAYLNATTLIFTRYAQTQKKQQPIWVVGTDGKNAHGLLGGSGDTKYAQQVDVSPDGKTLLFAGYNGKTGKAFKDALYTADTSGKNVTLLVETDKKGQFFNGPVWSPDGLKVAVSQEGETGKKPTQLKVITVATKASITVTSVPKGGLLYPSWQAQPAA